MIRLIRPYVTFSDVEDDLRRMFASGIFTRGENVEAFRSEIAAYTRAPHAFLATSATTALWLCLKRLEIGPGDEVIVSDFSFPATANVVEDLGAKPVFADVSLDTFNVTPAALRNAFSVRTKAVIAVDAFGNPTGMGEIAELCRARSIPFIEDAACAIGSAEHGIRCGAIADMTCFSFHPRKLLTTGEGGAITINDSASVDWFNTKLSHGAFGMLGFGLDFVDFGYNFRLSEPQAIMGRVQLRKLDEIVAERNVVRQACIERLSPSGFMAQQIGGDVVFNVQSLVFRVPEHVHRDALIAGLREEGIETTIGTYCLSGTTYYQKRYNNIQPNAARLQRETITLPCYAGVDIARVCESVLARTHG